ncbi:MAG: DUF1684 domain-containing protein [Candidatus Binatia bacterium]
MGFALHGTNRRLQQGKIGRQRRRSTGRVGLLCGLLLSAVAYANETAYMQDLATWRTAYAQRLQAEDGWLTVVGLYWLNVGENQAGTDSSNDIVLRAGSAPQHVGVFEFRQGKTTFHAAEGTEVRQQGRVVRSATLMPGPGTGAAPADALSVGALTLWVHQSGERFAIRVRDPQSPLRTGFTGCKWFPVDPAYKITGRFVPYDTPKAVTMPNIMGDLEHYSSPGWVQFEIQGRELRLQPVSTGTDRLFFVFRDQTSDQETYGAGRFLVTDGPRDGHVFLDFNKAVNPPCAYNPYTTCPLPLKENRLPIRLEAGELKYK